MDPYWTRIYLSLEVPYEAKFFALYGGDDGARTRDLCRDSAEPIGFSTTYNDAGTAKIPARHIRPPALWVGLWVGK